MKLRYYADTDSRALSHQAQVEVADGSQNAGSLELIERVLDTSERHAYLVAAA